ncbi:MAG TPA: hypothetical protein ENH06_01210 [bacterium]|nr:hypothetical protein [bacterium]
MSKITAGSIIDIMIIALLAGILLPIGLLAMAGANVTGLSSSAQTIWANLDVLLLVAVMLGIVGFFRK